MNLLPSPSSASQSTIFTFSRSIPRPRESCQKALTIQLTSKKNAARTKTFLKNEHNVTGTKNMDHHLTDSGFESFERYSGLKSKKIKSRASVIKSESKFVPFDVSFVGGKFSLNIFKVKVNRMVFHLRQQCHSNFIRLSSIERRNTNGSTATSIIFSYIVPTEYADRPKFAGQNNSIVTL